MDETLNKIDNLIATGVPVKTGVGYYPYKDSYVMVKARKR